MQLKEDSEDNVETLKDQGIITVQKIRAEVVDINFNEASFEIFLSQNDFFPRCDIYRMLEERSIKNIGEWNNLGLARVKTGQAEGVTDGLYATICG